MVSEFCQNVVEPEIEKQDLPEVLFHIQSLEYEGPQEEDF